MSLSHTVLFSRDILMQHQRPKRNLKQSRKSQGVLKEADIWYPFLILMDSRKGHEIFFKFTDMCQKYPEVGQSWT